MPAGQGVLAIRDADETQTLASPTRVTGTVDEESGVLSGVAMTTPPLEFKTVALGFPVDVKATFTQVGQGTGLVAATPPAAPEGQAQRGTVALRLVVTVTLDLKVRDPRSGGIILDQRCVTPTPVSLELLSDGPYTEAAGGKVVDPDFEIPPVPTSATCIAQVAEGVNGLLGGSGHSLSMVVKGDLPVPELKPETTTTLTVGPAGGSIRGNPVTLTAAVAPVEPNDLDPTGTVVFKDATRTVGTADLAPDGTASLTTTELRAGTRSLTAAYQGDAEFAPSDSAPVAYDVAPAPIITGAIPERVVRGAAPVEFDLAIDNTGSPRPVANARVDLVLPGVNSGNLVLEQQLPDSTWVTVPMPYVFPAGASGTLGPDAGILVPANATKTYRLRVSAPASVPARHLTMELALVSVDPGTGDDGPTVATAEWPLSITLPGRVATSTLVGVYDSAGLRPGHTLYVEATVTTATGTATTGQVEFLIDGQVMPFSPFAAFGPLAPKQTRATIDGGQATGLITLPSDLSTGPHIVSARYLGDASFLPSMPQGVPGAPEGDGPYILRILDPLGPLYTCDFVSVISDRFGAYVEAYVRLPAHAVDGEELDLTDLDVTVIPGGIGAPAVLGLLPTDGTNGVAHVEIDLGDAGSAEGDGLTFTSDENSGDHRLGIQGLQGSIVVDGEPGEVMPLPIERITMTGIEPTVGAQLSFTCLPQGEPVVLEDVLVAGVSLAVASGADPVRVGDEVVLTAAAAPASALGLVEFFAGSASLGTVSGASGTATIAVDDLPEGTHFLSARYTGVRGSPYRSAVVELVVRPAVECAGFAEPGTSATVRLVYLELLGRCPDQAGFDYWTGRLDGGTSPEVFARSISATPEAVGRVVDDAYVTMLGRRADAPGRAFWVNRMRSGSGRYDQLLADLGASPEFWSKAGASNAGFVGRVYERLLDRAPEQAGRDFWVGRLNAGTSPRVLIVQLANLNEPLGVLVGDAYDEILSRGPDATERADGIAFLRRTGDRSGLYAQLIGRPEFASRAQGFPNPED